VVGLRAADDQLRAATDFLCSVECRIGGAQPALAG
jgi:hypothetical protein